MTHHLLGIACNFVVSDRNNNSLLYNIFIIFIEFLMDCGETLNVMHLLYRACSPYSAVYKIDGAKGVTYLNVSQWK